MTRCLEHKIQNHITSGWQEMDEATYILKDIMDELQDPNGLQ